jgi:hypothetical protein
MDREFASRWPLSPIRVFKSFGWYTQMFEGLFLPRSLPRQRTPQLPPYPRLLLGRQGLPGIHSLVRAFTTRIPEIRACALLDIA